MDDPTGTESQARGQASRSFFFLFFARVLVLATTQQSSAPRLATHLMASCPIALMRTSIVRSVPSVRASRDNLDPHWTITTTPPPQARYPCWLPAQPLLGQWATSPAFYARPQTAHLRARLPALKTPAIGYR